MKHFHVLTLRNKAGQKTWSRRLLVRDGTQSLFVNRTTLDVLQGERYNVEGCGDAFACRREAAKFPHPVYGVQAFYHYVFVVDRLDSDGMPAHLIRYQSPEEEARIKKAFDHGFRMPPGIVHLLAPTGSHRLGHGKQGKATKSGSGGGKITFYQKAKKKVVVGYNPTREARMIGQKGAVIFNK